MPMPTHIFAPPASLALAPGDLADELRARAPHLTRRFLCVRPELDREDGAWGVALALAWLRLQARSGRPWERCDGGALIWDQLARLQPPPASDPCVVVDAAVGFLGFVGACGLLPEPEAGRLRQEARVEGLTYLAVTMGLLPPGEARRRERRFAR